MKTLFPHSDGSRLWRTLFWITAASVLIRLVFVIFFSGFTNSELLDSERYTRVALNLLSGNGFAEWGNHPTAFVPPFYPFFLAGCYGLFGVHPMLVKIIQAVLGGLLPLTVFGIGRRLTDDRTALLASAMTAVYPDLVVLTGYLYTETFFILLECLFFLFLLDAFHADRPKDWILSGIFFGLGMLVRNLLFYFPPFLFFSCLVVKPFRKRIKKIALMAGIGYALLIPWIVRNSRVFHHFVPVNTMGPILLWVGSDVARGGQYRYSETQAVIETMTAGIKNEPDRDNILLHAALQNIRENPGGYARLCIDRAVRYFVQIYENIPSGTARRPNRLILMVLAFSYYPLLIFGLAGLWMSRHDLRKWAPLIWLFAYALLMFSATLFVPRYRIPLIPFLCLFAASGFTWIAKSLPNVYQRRG